MDPSALNIERSEALLAYLCTMHRIPPTESPTISVLKGGVSNRTVLVERPTGECWVLKQALPKLRTQADWFSDPARIEREAAGLQWLSRIAPSGSITPLCFTDFDHHLLCMQAVPTPHENWKSLLLAGRISEDHVTQFGSLLGIIHRRGRELSHETACLFDDRSFFESLRIEPYYDYTASQVPAAGPFLDQLVTDTRARRLTVVHGDYSPKNVLIHKQQLVLLDHEVIHFGDPAFDVGFAMAHFLSKAHHLPQHRPAFAAAATRFWTAYTSEFVAASGKNDICVRHSLGCLLARVAGRSPLEYLDWEEREQQKRVVVELMQRPPGSIDALAQEFVQRIDQCP
jgi:tRNA A-37 threonylcarbamoyl transferase component Bud32